MKNILLLFVFFLLIAKSFSQEINFPIVKSTLKKPGRFKHVDVNTAHYYKLQYVGAMKDSIQYRTYGTNVVREEKMDFQVIKKLGRVEKYFPDTNLTIIVDTTQVVGIRELEYGVDAHYKWKSYNAYPVLIRSTADNFTAIGMGNRLPIEIEALDKNGVWQIIEKIFILKCGTGLLPVWLKPGDIAITSIPVYSGKIKTMLRVKLYESYSKPFAGSIVNTLLPAK